MTQPTAEPTPEPTGTFSLTGDLPEGTVLLEASAGTGKTFTVGALVTRFVAEGHATLDEMLVVTFGRAASQELRERVRDQLVEAERALSRHPGQPGDERADEADNEVVAHLLALPEAARADAVRRLRDALATFDAATIATTHQFCQLVLRSLGIAGDTDAGAELVESLDDLVVEVVDDLYLARFGHLRTPPPFDRARALDVARAAVQDRHAGLVGGAADAASSDGRALDETDPADARVLFAHAVRDELDRRKRRLGILSYDDLLSRLAAALEGEDSPARARMRGRWRIVLVDEFQDTDPVQWDVLDRAFSQAATMVLIGDPKQAIYGFRGGDVVAYLAAARTAAARATLGTNRRSDADLLSRLQVVLRGAALGDSEIVVREVAAHHRDSRLAGAPHPSPFRVRRVPRTGFRLTKGGDIATGDARRHIAADCAADIAELLASDATWCGRGVEAADVAVIVAARDHGLLVQAALAERGVTAVLAGGGHVLTTPAADAWTALLEGLAQPHRSGSVRAAALTPFFGQSARALDEGGDELTDRVADTLRGWALVLRGRGVAGLFEVTEERGLSARVLGTAGGERLMTDLRHLAQLLHETSLRDDLGLTGLLQWTQDERLRAAKTERPRRLDSDTAAVQIVTVHGSKGLQYPVTYLPFAYQSFAFPTEVARYHDGDQRTLDVRGSGPGWSDHLAAHRAEESGEELRDLYVALTRAQSQVVAWWAPTFNTRVGGLHRLLFGRQPGVAVVPDETSVRDDDYTARVLDLIEQLGGPTHEVSEVVPAAAPLPATSPAPLEARVFGRHVDTDWRRTSYSGLVRAAEPTGGGAHSPAQGGVGSEPEVPALQDEPQDEQVLLAGGLAEGLADGPDPGAPVEGSALLDGPEDPVSPMAHLPAGAAFGSLVHGVLEVAEPDAPDLAAELRSRVAEHLPWWPVDVTADELAEALLPLHATPLGALAPGVTLADVSLRDRLCELDFEFPLAGGDVRVSGVAGPAEPVLRDLAPLLRAHLHTDDALASYADQLDQPGLGDQPLRGYLSGSIDVVLRVDAHDGTGPRYLVVDYKTNLLGEAGRLLRAADYARDPMAAAMLHSHYPLQALLYAVVLHRYLRWRQPGYDPAVHLGGVLYLFLRGMCGPDTPVVDGHVAGVFDWSPPPALVVALSDLLAGRGRGREGAA